MWVNFARLIVLLFAIASGLLSVRCLHDASRGGDFGQIYSWAFGVLFGVVSAGGILVVWLLG